MIGRHLFDTTNGWDGKPAAGRRAGRRHPPAAARGVARQTTRTRRSTPPHSVEAGIALAKKLAGDGLVCVTAGDLGGQAFSAGLVDEVAMDVVPVVLGEGVRFFGSHAGTVLLDDPDQVVQRRPRAAPALHGQALTDPVPEIPIPGEFADGSVNPAGPRNLPATPGSGLATSSGQWPSAR